MFSVYPIPSWWLREYFALSYYHHQIGNMNYYPLFRVRSWNNGMRCMSLYILTTQIARSMGPTWGPPGSCRSQMGPMLVPWTLLSGYISRNSTQLALWCVCCVFGTCWFVHMLTEPLFTHRTDVLPQNLLKYRSREIWCYNDCIALKFDRYLGSTAAEMLVKFRSLWKSLKPNPAASCLNEILR